MSVGDVRVAGSRERAGIVALFLLSAVAVAVAPLVMPASYSVVRNAISESAAQGVGGAWVARLGLLLMGLAVLWLASVARGRWGPWGTILFRGFGVLMLAAAAFAHKPWEPGVPFDRFEDTLHSVAASGMGVFTVGVVLVSLRRSRPAGAARALDIAAIGASVLMPLGMLLWPDVPGLLQRCMFGVAYVWYGAEALRRP